MTNNMKTIYNMKTNIAALFMVCFMVFGAHAQIDRSKQPEPGPAPKIDFKKLFLFILQLLVRFLY